MARPLAKVRRSVSKRRLEFPQAVTGTSQKSLNTTTHCTIRMRAPLFGLYSRRPGRSGSHGQPLCSAFHLPPQGQLQSPCTNHKSSYCGGFVFLRPCLSCLFFFPRINVGSQFRPPTYRTVLNVSICRFEKVVECFESSPTF